MNEKITHLKDHLPEFMVRNAKIYSILSKGIHELSEKECLAFFEVAKGSIVKILKEDEQKRQELLEEKRLSELIDKFGSDEPSSQ